jgi:hypothetical protein
MAQNTHSSGSTEFTAVTLGPQVRLAQYFQRKNEKILDCMRLAPPLTALPARLNLTITADRLTDLLAPTRPARKTWRYGRQDGHNAKFSVPEQQPAGPSPRHARESDFGHAIPYDQGGKTCACNAGARSRACHQVKQAPGWHVTQPKPGWHHPRTPPLPNLIKAVSVQVAGGRGRSATMSMQPPRNCSAAIPRNHAAQP